METTVKEFLKERCTKVKSKEKDSYVELMMDNHKCIQYGKYQYYIPENNLYWIGDDEIIFNFLVDNYGL